MQKIARIQISHFSYLQTDLIGSGYKSQVYKGQNDLTGEIVAIKVCDMSQFTNEVETYLLNQEIQALKLLDSPNIIKMHGCIRNKQFTFIITEFCNQGDLEQLIKQKKQIPEEEAIILFRYIITGFLEQIAKGIIHRDIKPSNILLNNGIPKIADYGFSKMIASKETVYYNVGTTLYMSPQALVENQYSEKSDIWSIGVMFYQSLCGCMPWVAETEKEFIKIITSTPVQFPKKILLSLNVKDFILKCLAVDQKKRLSAVQLLEQPIFIERPRLLQISGSFHVPRNTQYQQRGNESAEIRRRLSPREVVNQNHNYFANSSKPLVVVNQTKIFLQNDLILQNVFYLLKFILRIAKLIDHFEFFTQFGLHEKLLYFIIKHALFKSKQFKQMIEQNINTLGLSGFHQYASTTDMKKQYQFEVNELHNKFQRSFDRLWARVYENQQLYSTLIQDRKFSAAFDKSELEVVSHYVLMLSILKQSIFELQTQLQIKLNVLTDFQKLEPREEAAVILIDYLVTYTQICNNIIFHFDDFSHRIATFQLKKIVETKPASINKCKFREICSQITNLQLML